MTVLNTEVPSIWREGGRGAVISTQMCHLREMTVYRGVLPQPVTNCHLIGNDEIPYAAKLQY